MAFARDVSLRKFIKAIDRRRVLRDVFEIALVALAFLFYFLVRGSVVDREDEALRNAIDIIDLERTLGFFWEPELNAAILDHQALIQLFNAVYFWGDFPLIVGIGLWLYFFGHRHEYTVARDAVLASGAIALVIYHLYPVMPPRLLPPELGFGFIDTLEAHSNLSYQAQSTQPFVNPYAAVPSLHYGWAALVGGVLFWATRNPWLRTLGVLMPIAQLTSIVFTANHYIFDAMVGLAVALLGLLVAMALQRWGYARIQRLFALRVALPAPAGGASSRAGPRG